MVVLAASICSRGGKPIISRQFKELTKEKVTSLLANFPSLLSDTTKTQHTSVEDEYVRYVYQPLEEFYVVLITNKHSNILQDIDTLHLFTQTITSILRNIDEREIFDNCFELLSAFDEIVCLGYKENLSSSQIITFLEMDSHEEKIQEIIERNKELEAAEASKKKAAELQFKEMLKKNQGQDMFDSMQYGQQINTNPMDRYADLENERRTQELEEQQRLQAYQKQQQFQQQQTRKGGLQLGKKSNKIGDIEAQPLLVSASAPVPQQSKATIPSEPTKERIANNGILITINEKFSAQITREGSINSSEVKGDLQIRICDEGLAHGKINLSINTDNEVSTQFKTHPNIDKKLFNSSSIIGLKDPTKPFPSNDQNLGVLRWRSTTKSSASEDDAKKLLPIILTTWVNNNSDGTIVLTFEYESEPSKNVDEVNIIIPIINASIESSDYENTSLTFSDDGVIINLKDLIENPSGSFEILCKEVDDEESLFPMELVFDVTKQIESGVEVAEVSVDSVVTVDTQDPLPFDLYYNATNEGYYIV